MSSTKMFGINSAEMSKKLRAAIKAKLEELGVYVDEELPDYIMVMIANRKEKAQMKEDLLLFLGKNTVKFVDWLFEIFERLQSAGATLPSESNVQQNKKKDQSGSAKKDKTKEDVLDKKSTKKERESDGKHSGYKIPDKHKEKDKHEARIVKSKPVSHRRPSSKSPVRESSRSRKKSDTKSEVKEKDASIHRVEKKPIIAAREKSPGKGSKKAVEVKSSSSVDWKKSDSDTGLLKKRVDEKVTRASPVHLGPKSEKITIAVEGDSTGHVIKSKKELPAQDILDSDEEERIAEEESRKELYSKKVLSSAVLRVKQSEPAKTVCSKIVVKRKLPEKENAKNVRGAQSLFLKAIKEAGRMTRTASQIAGYGGGAAAQKSATKFVSSVELGKDNEQKKGPETEDDIDMKDTLVVMSSSETVSEERRQVGGHEFQIARKKIKKEEEVKDVSNQAEKTKFFVTLKNADIGLASRMIKTNKNGDLSGKARKRQRGPNEIEQNDGFVGSAVVVKPKKKRNLELSAEFEVDVAKSEEEVRVRKVVHPSETAFETQRNATWDRLIPLEEDSSDDDEAQIDAVLASAHTVTVGFDEVPPTPTLTAPSLCVSNVDHVERQSPNTGQGNNLEVGIESTPALVSSDKIMERCKFWPNCRLEEGCIYIHPTKPCSNFPNCKFGDRCVYLHPLCKFDRNCANPHCVFVHSPKTSTFAATVSTSMPPAPVTSAPPTTTVAAPLNASIACKFGGKCANVSCTFKHPKLCRFGERCTNRNCFFRHLNMLPTSTLKSGALDRFKWKASIPA